MKKPITIVALLSGAFLLFSFRKKAAPSAALLELQTTAVKASKFAFGNLNQEQINSILEITKAFATYGDGDGSKLAYILATAWHESKLKPIKEYRANQGTALYSTQNNYWHTGYYGRGFVQLTWKDNYQKMANWLGIDLVNKPELALKTEVAAKIIVYGMINGSFTGKKLSDYIGGSYNDFYNARRIVNGLDKAQLINNYTINLVNYNTPVA